MYKIGCDQHKHYCLMHTLNQNGEFVNQEKIYHDDPQSMKNYLSQIPKESHMVIEACGFDAWLCDLVESYDIHIHLAHPLKTKAIAEARIKTDSLDAKTLAQLLHADLLAEAYYAPAELREKRYLFRYRQCLVRYQTSIKLRIHDLIDRQGIRSPELTDLFGSQGRLWLESLSLAPIYQKSLTGYLSLIDHLKELILTSERHISSILKEDPLASLLQSIPGIGKISAYALLYEIGPIDRFPTPEKLCSYAGLGPSVHQSGQRYYHGSITKQGNKFIRWILVEAAHRIIRKDPVLKSFYNRIRIKKGSQKAIVAVARKLLTYVFQILTKKEPYRYQPILPKKPAHALPL